MLPAGLFVIAMVIEHAPVWDSLVDVVLASFNFFFFTPFGFGGAGGGASLSYTVSLQVFIM